MILHPGIFLCLAAVVIAVLPKRIRQILMVAAPALALIMTLRIPMGTELSFTALGRYEFVYLRLTEQNYAFLLVFSMLALFAGIFACHHADRLESFASLSYAGGGLAITLAGDWLTLLFFWELIAVTSLFVIWAARTEKANKAGMRYLFIHMFGGSSLLFGVILKISSGATLITNLTNGPHDLAFWLIFIGFGVNVGMVPLHAWVPDAYPEASVTGSVFLSSLTTKIAVLAILQVFLGFKPLIIIGLIMMFYGVIFALMENNVRRLLSYHIISQLGYMVVDLGLGGNVGADAATALAFGNVLYKSLLFMCMGAIIYTTGICKINELGRLAKKMPLVCICFLIAGFSIAGFPGFAGFTCKSLSMIAAEEAGYHAVELLMTFVSIGTSLSIPFKMGYFIFFGKERNIKPKPVPKNMCVAMVLGAASCMALGICPRLMYGILPYAIDYTPYTFEHLMEYMQLIPAVLLVFFLYLKKMEPHHKVSMDFDWFARIPLPALVTMISFGLCWIEKHCAKLGRTIYHILQHFSSDPVHKVIPRKRNETGSDKRDPNYYADTYRSEIGEGMIAVIIVVLLIAIIFAFHFIRNKYF